MRSVTKNGGSDRTTAGLVRPDSLNLVVSGLTAVPGPAHNEIAMRGSVDWQSEAPPGGEPDDSAGAQQGECPVGVERAPGMGRDVNVHAPTFGGCFRYRTGSATGSLVRRPELSCKRSPALKPNAHPCGGRSAFSVHCVHVVSAVSFVGIASPSSNQLTAVIRSHAQFARETSQGRVQCSPR